MITQTLITLSPEELKNLVSSCIKSELQDYHNKEPPVKDDSLMSRADVCKYLQISKPCCISYERRQILKSFRVGGKILFKKADVYNSLKLVRSIKHSRRENNQ